MASVSEMATAAPETPLTFSEFYQAVLASPELAAYLIRVGDHGEFTFEDANEFVAKTARKPLSDIIGRTPEEVLLPEVAECITTNLRRCVETGEVMAYRRSFHFANGNRVSFRTSLMPVVREPGRAKYVVGFTRDVTHEAALIENAEHNAALLKTLGIALPAAVYMIDLGTRTLKFIGGEASATQLAWRRGAEGVGPERAKQFFHPDDWPRLEAHWTELAALADGEVSTVSYRLLATKGVYRRHVNREIVFSRDGDGNVKLVLGVSLDVSEQDRMQQEVRDLSARILTLQLEERRRMAHELHDSTGQHLTAATLALGNAQALRRAATGDEIYDSLLAVIDDAAGCVAEAQREIQVLSYLLHPPELISHGLPEALENFAKGFGKRARIRISVDVSPEARTLDDDTAVQLFRICQEALTNVYRHADARKAQVTLEVGETAIRLAIKDDGVGIEDSAQEMMLGVGLSGMRERINRLGGTFEIWGDPSGTTLVASLPRVHLPMPRKRGWSFGSRAAASWQHWRNREA